MTRFARVLSIAGSDSGGGAGIQADLKTAAALGCYGMTAVTAVTVQNTIGVRRVVPLEADVIEDQVRAVVDDIGVDAVKVGMVHSPAVAETVARLIADLDLPAVVVDPVMVATSGDQLMQDDTMTVLVDRLLPSSTVITPNLDEAELLVGHPLRHQRSLVPAAQELWRRFGSAVLLKGGHLRGPEVTDVLVNQAGEVSVFTDAKVDTRNLHGTGCTLSTAVACRLALGDELEAAVARARGYVLGALRSGARIRTGRGSGPLDHGWAPVATHLID